MELFSTVNFANNMAIVAYKMNYFTKSHILLVDDISFNAVKPLVYSLLMLPLHPTKKYLVYGRRRIW